jgi:HlyD family secretion protein
VKQVRFAPETVQNVVTYDAVVSVKNPEVKLRPGMTADVAFVVDERHSALMVPNTALRFRPPNIARDPLAKESLGGPSVGKESFGSLSKSGGPRHRGGNRQLSQGAPGERHAPLPDRDTPPTKRMVWKLSSQGKPIPVRVEIGISDGRNTEIIAGELTDGDQVIIGINKPQPDKQGDRAPPRPPGRFL